MNSFEMWRAVDPLPSEIQAATAAFDGLDVIDILPRLVMVRRAVAACFYNDDLPKNADSQPACLHEAPPTPPHATTQIDTGRSGTRLETRPCRRQVGGSNPAPQQERNHIDVDAVVVDDQDALHLRPGAQL